MIVILRKYIKLKVELKVVFFRNFILSLKIEPGSKI